MALPNILILFTDDQRFDTIQALGNPQIKTPSLDRLVARGTAFTQAHIPGGTVGAVCMPSRAMLHTGRTLFRLQDSGSDVPADHALLGECLGQAGYATWGTGKWHNGKAAFNRSFQQGEEIFFGGMADHWNVPAHNYDSTGAYEKKLPVCADPFGGKAVTERSADHIHCGVHSTDLFGKATQEFLRKQTGEQPFFAYTSFMAPHDPRIMPSRFREMYRDEDIDLPANFRGGHPWDTGAIHIRDEMLAAFPRTEKEVREHLADYYGMISHLDHVIGETLNVLEEMGQLENTIVVLAGDNGLALGQHGLMGKQSLYDHSVRVPLIMAGPGIAQGRTCDSLVYLLDIFPTLCELTGLDIPTSVEGRSFASCLTDASVEARDQLYLVYGEFQRGLRQDDFKLIEWQVEGERHSQLFDLKNDPAELCNLAWESDQATRLQTMRKALQAEAKAWDDEATSFGQAFWGGMENWG